MEHLQLAANLLKANSKKESERSETMHNMLESLDLESDRLTLLDENKDKVALANLRVDVCEISSSGKFKTGKFSDTFWSVESGILP